MVLLKQTALILGLLSLSLGGLALVRDFKNKITILFSTLCFIVSIWSLSFVAHVTLLGRLSYDIHLFCNLLLVPFSIALISNLFLKRLDAFTRVLISVSAIGVVVLGLLLGFSIETGEAFKNGVRLWPSLVLIYFLYIIYLDYLQKSPIVSESISRGQKMTLYLGVAFILLFCTFDHIPALGHTVPAVGNLVFSLFLLFTSQVISPQKVLGLEALISRFFAVLILSLLITGFFALLYSYVSESFALFLLNSFLISFAILTLWEPLLSLFRYLTKSFFAQKKTARQRIIDEFRVKVFQTLQLKQLVKEAEQFYESYLSARSVRLVPNTPRLQFSEQIRLYLSEMKLKNLPPLFHRELIQREREQVLSAEKRKQLDEILEILNAFECDVLIPIESFQGPVAALLIQVPHFTGDDGAGFSEFLSLKELNEELGANYKRLSDLGDAKERERLIMLGEMAAGLAHEIRNPLGSIKGAAELISHEGNPWARVISQEVSRLNRLVTQFLDFSQDSKEGSESVDLNVLVQESIENIKPALAPEVKIEVALKDSPLWISVVPDRVQQVLHNLILNAVKATTESENKTIQVVLSENGFSVVDYGIGMSDEVLSKIFQPFFTAFKEGTGLGMAICERLVHLDSGSIHIESKPGFGTTVRVEYHAR